MGNKKTKILIAVLVVALLAGVGFYYGIGENGLGLIKIRPKKPAPEETSTSERTPVQYTGEAETPVPVTEEAPQLEIEPTPVPDTYVTPPVPSTSSPVRPSVVNNCGNGEWERIFRWYDNDVVDHGDVGTLSAAITQPCDFKVTINKRFPDDMRVLSSFECSEARFVHGQGPGASPQKSFTCVSDTNLGSHDVYESSGVTVPSRGGAYYTNQIFTFTTPNAGSSSMSLYTYRQFPGDDARAAYEDVVRVDLEDASVSIFARK